MDSILESIVAIKTQDFPIGYRFERKLSVGDFEKWYQDRKEEINEKLQQAGAILFRGVGVEGIDDFSQFSRVVFGQSLDYKDGTTPRTKLAEHVYTSTEYDPSQEILPHNELSYSNVYPGKLLFCCTTVAPEGGETPLGDSRQILRNMPEEIVEEFRSKELMYIRNLHGGGGLGQSWQQSFETDDREIVEAFCDQNEVAYTWKASGHLHLVQHRPGIIRHPHTNEEVWFNQVDQFHPSHIDAKLLKTLMMIHKNDVRSLPMFVCYGDGTEIADETIAQIRKCIDGQMKANPWVAGDIVLVDNLLVCHGRRPYKGDRKVLVSMDT